MKTMLKTSLASLFAAAFLTGCAAADVRPSAARQAAIQLTPRVASNGFQAQSTGGYSLVDIDHLVLKLFRVAGGTESAVIRAEDPLQVDIASSSLGGTVTIGNLHHNTRYRVRAYAYKAPGTGESDLISSESSYVDIDVTQDLRPTMGVIPVRLIDRTAGISTATSSFTVYPGGVIAPSGPASASW